jgi:hypothetical protein
VGLGPPAKLKVVLRHTLLQFKLCSESCRAIIDTGTSLIGGPPDDIEQINAFIGAKRSKYGEYIVDCDSVGRGLPDVTLVFGGKEFSMPAEEYILKIEDGKTED